MILSLALWQIEVVSLAFFQAIHVRIDVRNDISISIRPMIPKFGKQVHLQNLSQMKLI